MRSVSELREGRQYRSRREAILESILAVADASSEDDRAYHAAWCRFWITMKRAGWTPPLTNTQAPATTDGPMTEA